MKTIGRLFLFTSLLIQTLASVYALEIQPLDQEESFVSACPEREHQKITKIKKEILNWENSSVYLQANFDQGSRISSLIHRHKKLMNELEILSRETQCFTQKGQLLSLLEKFSAQAQWLENSEAYGNDQKITLSLCEIQLKNTSQIFERAIASLEQEQKHHAFYHLGQTTFEIDRVLATKSDCREFEREKLEEIRAHALSTLDQIQI